MPPKQDRRKVIKTMSHQEILNEIDDIRSILPHVDAAERAKLRVRLSNLEKALDVKLEGGGGEGGGAGGAGRAPKQKRKLNQGQVDEITDRIDAINAAIDQRGILGGSDADIIDLENQRDGLIAQLQGQADAPDSRQRKQAKKKEVEVIDLLSSDDESSPSPSPRRRSPSPSPRRRSPSPSPRRRSPSPSPRASSSSSGGAGAGAEYYRVPPYEPVVKERGAGESDLDYLGRLVRGRVQLQRVIDTLRTEHTNATERAAASAAKFAEEDRALEDKFNEIESHMAELEGAALTANQDRAYENVQLRYRLKMAHREDLRQLQAVQQETLEALGQRESELGPLSDTINNLQVKPRVAFAIRERYPGKNVADAWESFVNDHSSFGRRKVCSLMSFFGKYKSQHPRASTRTVVQKYARALMYA